MIAYIKPPISVERALLLRAFFSPSLQKLVIQRTQKLVLSKKKRLDLNCEVQNLLNPVDTSFDNIESKQKSSYIEIILVIFLPKNSPFPFPQVEEKDYFYLTKNM